MKLTSNLLGALALLLIALCSHAESDSTDTLDPVVVTATREEAKESEIANTVTVISAKEIKSRRINSVSEILKVVPGVDVLTSGGPGHATSVFTRGANSNQTLVLIDNVMMNDPGSPNGAFDFANLQVDNIERIEVLRGAASAMWGADAMGGVIHIITKHGSGTKPQFTALAEGGNYATWKLGGGVSGTEGKLNYTINASHLSNVGVSAAAASFGNTERDPYQNTTVQARLGYQVTSDFDLDWTLRFNNGVTGLDNCGGGSLCDNPFYWQNTNEVYTRGQARLFLLDRKWEQRFGINLSQTNRQTWYSDQNGASNLSTTSVQPNNNQGQQIKIEWINFIRPFDFYTVTAGIEEKYDTLSSIAQAFTCPPNANAGVCLDPSTYYYLPFSSTTTLPTTSYQGNMNNSGYYLQNEINWLERMRTTLGGRLDSNSIFGNHMTWRFNQLVSVPELNNRIKANVGTAFRPPSLCELTVSCYGNPNLQPETSLDWDAGIEQDLLDKKISLGVLYFHNKFNNLIQYNPNANGGNGNTVNVENATSQGIESYLEYKPWDRLSLRLNYTFNQTQGYYDQTYGIQTNQALLLRPKNKGNFDLDYHFTDRASAHLNILAFGARSSPCLSSTGGSSTACPASGVTDVPGYVLLNLSGNYELNEQVTLFARMDNLLNKTYQQVWGYGTMGFTGIGGLNLKL